MHRFILLISAMLFSSGLFAQDKSATNNDCNDPAVHSALITLDNNNEISGFSLKMFKTFSMPSGSLIPITFDMQQGVLYNINFVVSPQFSQYTFTIMGKDNAKYINEKWKVKKRNEHYISHNFVAPYTGEYVIIVSQKVKHQKEACGGISLMKAAETK